MREPGKNKVVYVCVCTLYYLALISVKVVYREKREEEVRSQYQASCSYYVGTRGKLVMVFLMHKKPTYKHNTTTASNVI